MASNILLLILSPKISDILGITTTAISDGSTTSTISIDGSSVTFGASDAGSVVIYGEKEFVWNGTKWQEFGSTGSLKALAFKDSASGSFTPSGDVTVSTNSTTNKTATVSKANSGTATYTPEGTVTPNITMATTTVNSITDVGVLPSLTATVTNENLTLGWSAGTLPTKGSDISVATGIQSATATFTGTGARLVTGNIAVPSTYTATFTGTAGTVTVS